MCARGESSIPVTNHANAHIADPHNGCGEGHNPREVPGLLHGVDHFHKRKLAPIPVSTYLTVQHHTAAHDSLLNLIILL